MGTAAVTPDLDGLEQWARHSGLTSPLILVPALFRQVEQLYQAEGKPMPDCFVMQEMIPINGGGLNGGGNGHG